MAVKKKAAKKKPAKKKACKKKPAKKKLVEKIINRNAFRPYPDINDIPSK